MIICLHYFTLLYFMLLLVTVFVTDCFVFCGAVFQFILFIFEFSGICSCDVRFLRCIWLKECLIRIVRSFFPFFLSIFFFVLETCKTLILICFWYNCILILFNGQLSARKKRKLFQANNFATSSFFFHSVEFDWLNSMCCVYILQRNASKWFFITFARRRINEISLSLSQTFNSHLNSYS